MAGEMSQLALSVNVHLERSQRHSPKFVLDVALDFPLGVTIIFGASGAGKSTLLSCISGLLKPQAGKITIGGETIFEANAKINVRPEYRHMGYVFQSLALFPHLAVKDNVTYGLANLSHEQQSQRASEILSAFQIEALGSRKPAELSGGEQQRVALARSLVTQPRALLLDEPMTGLDDELKTSITRDLLAWNDKHRIPILYVTHSKEEAATLGGRLVFLKHGKVVEQSEAITSAAQTRPR
jgi:molybdate transport system ATP-binding protein